MHDAWRRCSFILLGSTPSTSTLQFLHDCGVTLDVADFIVDHADYVWTIDSYIPWLDAMDTLAPLTTPARR